MKLGSLIPKVNILCVKLQYSLPPQANFFIWYLFVLGVCIFSTRTLPPLRNFEVRTLIPLYSKIFAIYPFKSEKIVPPSARRDEGMIEGVRGTSIGV